MRLKHSGGLARGSRFEREIADFHGEAPVRVIIEQAAERAPRWSYVRVRRWWIAAAPLERFFRVWLYSLIGIVGIGIGVMAAALVFGPSGS